MNASPSTIETEPGWKTYGKAAGVVIPALCAWAFCWAFLVPKLQELWRVAGFTAGSARAALGIASLITEHGVMISTGVILVLILLEWRSSRWPRHRRTCVGVAAFVVNTAVLVMITGLFLTAMMTAPALMRLK